MTERRHWTPDAAAPRCGWGRCRTCSTSGHVAEGTTIRQLREERGWSQAALAARLGVDSGTIHTGERALRMPHPRTGRRLATAFGADVEDMAFGLAEQTLPDGP